MSLPNPSGNLWVYHQSVDLRKSYCSLSALVEQELQQETQVAWFKKQYFGAKSEKLIPQDPRQSTLFDVPDAAPPEKTSVKQYERQSRKNQSDMSSESKLRFDESVPVEEEIIYPKEVEG